MYQIIIIHVKRSDRTELGKVASEEVFGFGTPEKFRSISRESNFLSSFLRVILTEQNMTRELKRNDHEK